MSVTFNGASQRLTFASVSALSSTAAGTTMGWVLVTTLQDTRFMMFDSADVQTYAQMWDTGMLVSVARRAGGDSADVQVTGDLLTLGRWHHFAQVFEWSGQGHRVYLDGVLVASSAPSSWTANSPATTCAVAIGAGNGTYEHLSGSMSDVRVYDRALTLAEIQAVAAGKGVDAVSDYIHRWYLDGTPVGGTIGASAVVDIGPGAINGSGVNSPVWSIGPLQTETVSGDTIAITDGAANYRYANPTSGDTASVVDGSTNYRVTWQVVGDSCAVADGAINTRQTTPIAGASADVLDGSVNYAQSVPVAGATADVTDGGVNYALSAAVSGASADVVDGSVAYRVSVPTAGALVIIDPGNVSYRLSQLIFSDTLAIVDGLIESADAGLPTGELVATMRMRAFNAGIISRKLKAVWQAHE